MPRLSLEVLPDEPWVIWSEEHEAWWRPNSRGYTSCLKQAGQYSEEDAKAIERSANNDGRHFNELAMSLPAYFLDLVNLKTRR